MRKREMEGERDGRNDEGVSEEERDGGREGRKE